MDLYYTPGTCALASHIALRDAGARFTLHRIDFSKEMQKSEAYLGVNPKARVPALVVDGAVLTETPAILAYVAQRYVEAKLAPVDPLRFAEVQALNSYLCSTVHVAHAHRVRGSRWADDEAAIESMKRKAPEAVGHAWEHVEHDVLKGPFVFGETYTIADPYLFTVARWMEGDGLDMARYPKVTAHREMMAARAPVREALAAEA